VRLVFAGTPEPARVVLEKLSEQHEIALVLTRPDASSGRSRHVKESEVAAFAKSHNWPVLKANKLEEPELQVISKAEADLAVVVAYGVLLPPEALKLMPWWNLHFSELPSWRGAAPLQYSLIHQRGQGFTIFQLDQGLDTGPIVESVSLSLPIDKPAGELLLDLATQGAERILHNLASSHALVPQFGEKSYAPRISRSDARIDFNLLASEIQRRVYAFNPEPMSWCRAKDSDLRILSARAIGDVDWNRVSSEQIHPGEVLLDAGRVLVGCGTGTRLELIQVQPAGGKIMSASDWYRGFKGTKLD
jgi:methionyl-tRNA formyltransferase